MSPVTHKYEVGARLFCFEPDPSKAKLIYQAKVTQLCGYTNGGRSRVPLYFVHFLGWKRKWDREVPENLLMDITHFTKMLKQKIDELALNVKDKEKRKERIDRVLMGAAKARGNFDWDTLPGTWQKDEQPSKIRPSTSSSLDTSQFAAHSDSAIETEMDSDSLAQINFESLEAHANFAPKIKLPATLYAILESHCRPYETSRGSSVNSLTPVPSWCSVLHLLQTYLNGFPYFMSVNTSMGLNKTKMNRFPSTVFRERFSKAAAAAYLKTDRSRHLCAEFCCSVRILFDALLEEYLLYPNEEKKHSNCPKHDLQLPLKSQFNILPNEEIVKNPLIPCFVYDSIYILRLIVRLPALIDQMPLTKCRRSVVLRHLYLFVAYLDATRDFWFTATRPSLPAPLLPSSAPNTSDGVPPHNPVKCAEADAGSPVSATAAVTPPSKRRRRTSTAEPVSKALRSSTPQVTTSSSTLCSRTSTASRRRTSSVQLRNLRSRNVSIPNATTRSRNGKTATSSKASRQSLSQQETPSSASPLAKPQRRLTRASVCPMILRSARV